MPAVVPVYLVPGRRGWKLYIDREPTTPCYMDLGSALDAALALADGRQVRIVVGSVPPEAERVAA